MLMSMPGVSWAESTVQAIYSAVPEKGNFYHYEK